MCRLKMFFLTLFVGNLISSTSLIAVEPLSQPTPASSNSLEAINRKLAPRIAQAKAQNSLISQADNANAITPAAGMDGLPQAKQGLFPVQMPSYNGVTQLLPLSNTWVIVVTNNIPEICQEIANLVKNDSAMSSIDFLAAQQQWLSSVAANKPDWYNKKQKVIAPVTKYFGQARVNTGEQKLDDVNYYSITSSNDKNYQAALPPVSVSRFVTSVGGEQYPGIDPTFLQYSYLELHSPMVDGNSYTISLANGKSVTFTYDELTLVSRAIKVNQTGYQPDAGKFAYVGAYLQDQGPLTLSGTPTFTVMDVNSGQAVLTGAVSLRAANPRFPAASGQPADSGVLVSGENIYELDFSALNTPGTYFIAIAGVGRSWPFTIDSDVYAEAFYTQVRGFYHQRCGIAIGQPHTPWPRIKCHTDPAYECQYVPIFFEPLQDPQKWAIFDIVGGTTDRSKSTPDHQGGWHDAGDWDKNLRHYACVMDMLNLYELKPTVFTDKQFNIPESGNGIPDILDEAEYGLLVWKKSMTPEGGVAGFLETSTHPSIADPKYVYAYSLRTRWTSLLYAAAAAQYAQLVKPFNADKAAEYEASAKLAYTFGTNPKNALGYPEKSLTVPAKTNRGTGTDYSFTFSENDDFNKPFVVGAKIRLYLLTQDASYVSDLPQLLTDVQAGFNFTASDGKTSQLKLLPTKWPFVPADCGLWLFAGLMQPQMAQALPANVITMWKNQFISLADAYQVLNDKEFYRRSRTPAQATQMAWGGDCMTNAAKVLLFAHHLTQDQKYKQAALLNIDYMLGGNATGTSWTTGIGFTYPIPIHHAVSDLDGILDPVPGIAIYGPNEGSLSAFNSLWMPKDASGKVVQMLKPSLYTNGQVVLPRLRNYQAHPQLAVPMNEFTIWETMSSAVFAYGYLLNEGWTPPDWLVKRQPRDPRVLFGQWYVP